MLAAGVFAQAAVSLVQTAPAFLIPLLHGERGLSLVEAGMLAAAPNVGVLLTLVLWGAATDRWGERRIPIIGLTLTIAGVVGALLAQGMLALGIAFLVAGMGSASVSAASGRVVIGWFPVERRGLAMGIRQMSQPLGVMIGALTIPPLVADGRLEPALWLCIVAVAAALAFYALVVVNPDRPARATDAEGRPANPYRGDSALARIHVVSALLVVPQYVLATFGLVWLIVDQGWEPGIAGAVVGLAQFLGALGRIAMGTLSDRVGSRLRPLRWVALAGIPLLLLTAAAGAVHWPLAVGIAYVLASCVSVADNGLAFTAVAELAGAHWSGRALGVQNTGQFLTAAVAAPVVGALIGVVGYSAAFALVALAPAAALPLVPHESDERRSSNAL